MHEPPDDELKLASRLVPAVLRKKGGMTNLDELADAASVVILRALETWDPARGPFSAWACYRAEKWVLDERARFARRAETAAKLIVAVDVDRETGEPTVRPDYAGKVHYATLVADMDAALQAGPDAELLSTYLRLFLRDLGPSEIAGQMGIPLKQANSLWRKLIYRLRAHCGCRNPKTPGPEDRPIFEKLI